MGTKPCDICGGKASMFGVYAVCFPCRDLAIKHYISRRRKHASDASKMANREFEWENQSQ